MLWRSSSDMRWIRLEIVEIHDGGFHGRDSQWIGHR